MSAENFIKIFKDKRLSIDEASDYADYSRWTKTNKTWFNKNRSELEDLGLSKYVGLAISQTKADELGVGEAFRALAKEYSNASSDEKKPIVQIIDNVPVILFSNVPFKDGIERTLDNYFGKGTSAKYKEMGMIKGHIYGFMTGAFLGARDELYKFLTSSSANSMPIMSEEEADYALNFLDILVTHLQKLDLESAEIKTLTSPALLKYNKSATNFLIELQSEADNAASAKLVQKLAGQKSGTTGIRALINPSSTQQKALQGILEILQQDSSFSGQEIADFKSSPTLKELIVDEVLSEGFGQKRKYPKKVVSPKIKLPTNIVTAYVDKQAVAKYRKDLNKTIQDAKQSAKKIKATKHKHKQAKALANLSVNLLSLQNLINSQLQDVISANMGDGNRRDILNYRTGRLASSAKVERLSESREGMITAFYTYMKNPYATFSQGGKQSSPKSRDPKLLISKSIREIAQQQVANRLRAVAL